MRIDPDRISALNSAPAAKGKWVLYWMQQSQRAHDNLALETAINRANQLQLPVLVAFGLTDKFPEANLRHYRFMLEGLAETRQQLEKRRIGMVIQKGNPPEIALSLARDAAVVVCDVGYTRHQRKWRQLLSRSASCETVAVEADVVVPVETVSGKAEYAARTLRPKIQKKLPTYLVPCPRIRPRHAFSDSGPNSLDPEKIDAVLNDLAIDKSVPPVSRFFKGGPLEAKKRFRKFIMDHLSNYDKNHNQPQTDDISFMSPYLHFGQISPVYLALEIQKAAKETDPNREAWLEELIVRRELAANFVRYTPDYDRYDGLPAWAKKTLAEHAGDKRPYRYNRNALEAADTHDPYWNAAMTEMRDTGFMHNYMRMYWGKKILEWSKTPQEGFDTALFLNNKYFLDGRDPNSFAGVGWVFGLHDRAWFEREIFGKVRYMAASGLERKCDIEAYVEKVAALSRKASEE